MNIEHLASCREWIPVLARWHHSQWAVYNPGETLAGRVARLEANAASDDLPVTWVAVEGDVLLGSASLVVSDLETRPELKPWLASVFVAPEHRRRGVGGALVRHVVGEAAARSFGELYLFTPDRAPFYEKLGWRTVEELEYHGEVVALMRIDLGGGAGGR